MTRKRRTPTHTAVQPGPHRDPATSLGWLVEVVRLSPADVAMRVDLYPVEIAADPWNQDLNIFPLGERGAAGHVGRVTAVVFVGGGVTPRPLR